MLQYYLGISDPAALGDEAWAEKIKMLEHIRRAEAGKT